MRIRGRTWRRASTSADCRSLRIGPSQVMECGFAAYFSSGRSAPRPRACFFACPKKQAKERAPRMGRSAFADSPALLGRRGLARRDIRVPTGEARRPVFAPTGRGPRRPAVLGGPYGDSRRSRGGPPYPGLLLPGEEKESMAKRSYAAYFFVLGGFASWRGSVAARSGPGQSRGVSAGSGNGCSGKTVAASKTGPSTQTRFIAGPSGVSTSTVQPAQPPTPQAMYSSSETWQGRS